MSALSIYLLNGLGRASSVKVGVEAAPTPAWMSVLGIGALVSLAGLAAYGMIFGKGEERKLRAQGHFDEWERARRKRVAAETDVRDAKIWIEREEFRQKLAEFRRNNPGDGR